MAIGNLSGLIGAVHQPPMTLNKVASITTVAAQPFSVFDQIGTPGSGSLVVGNTTTGLVPTDADAGFPSIDTFGGGNTGYIQSILAGNTVACRLELFDLLYWVGSIPLNALATTTLSSQPSYDARLPGGSYNGLQIRLMIAAAVSATATTVTVNYRNELDVDQNTNAINVNGFTQRRMATFGLAAGAKGVKRINSITIGGTVATTGSVAIYVMRQLWQCRISAINGGQNDGPATTAMPIIYDTSALFPVVTPDSTASGLPSFLINIPNG